MERLPTRLDGPVLLRPTVHRDARGFFAETWREGWLDAGHGWAQDNHSRSVRGTLRGIHFQTDPGQAKLVRCPRGRILDVVVDLRRGSPTFGEHETVVVDDEDLAMLYVPVGFGHGFCVLSDEADVVYKCSSFYDSATEAGIAPDDPRLGIAWPEVPLLVSDRDRDAPTLDEVEADLPFTWPGGR